MQKSSNQLLGPEGCTLTPEEMDWFASDFWYYVLTAKENMKKNPQMAKVGICPVVKYAIGMYDTGPNILRRAVVEYSRGGRGFERSRACHYKSDKLCSRTNV